MSKDKFFKIGGLYKAKNESLTFGDLNWLRNYVSGTPKLLYRVTTETIITYIGVEKGVQAKQILIFLYNGKKIYRYKNSTYYEWFEEVKTE